LAKLDPGASELACGRLCRFRLEVDALAAAAARLRGVSLNGTGGAVRPGVEAIDNLTDLPSLIEDLRLI